MFTVKTDFGTYNNVELTTGRYPCRVPGNFYDPIFIQMHDVKEGPLATITVNVEMPGFINDKLVAIDTNNCPFAEAFIEENELGEKTGAYVYSGYCEYPVYEINLERLESVSRTV